MKEVTISLRTIDRVKNFVNQISQTAVDVDICAGNRYVIDAKSIMGIFSLDISKPVTLRIYADGAQYDEVIELVKDFIV